MKVQIKHRYSGTALFDHEAPAELSSGMALRQAIEAAARAGADLAGAH